VNLAARLMTSATPGQVLMSAPVGAALDRRFVIHPIDPIEVKGRVAPVAVCELVGTVTSGESLGEPRYPLPMVGREEERAAIDAALDAVEAGRGAVLAFSADAGMGKSRLVSTTIRRARERGIGTYVGECQPHGARIAYLPWHRVWSGLLGLPAEAPADDQRDALIGGLGAMAPNLVPLAPLLGTVLDLPMTDNDATRSMPAVVRKQVLEQVLTGLLRGRASAGPVLIALEDLHWVDELSRDLLAALASAIADVPVLIVLSYRRPEAGPPIPLQPGSEHVLGELTPDEATDLATMLLTHVQEDIPDASTVEAVTDRANGNPFFIEELVREIAERGTTDLPTSLENLILERIDRLSPGQKLTARVASVVGRRFSTAWLTEAFPGTVDARTLPADLAALTASGLIVEDTPEPDQAHLFRHVVVRDVAYETLGFHIRRDLHEQLAAYLEAAEDTPPALIAYHYARSANTAKEAVYRRLAGEVAIRNGAYAAALQLVQRAMEIVAGQPEGQERLEQELELALLLGSIQLVTDGQGSATAKATYDRARSIANELPPGPAVGRAVFGLWTYYLFQGLMGPTAELADEAVALTERSPDPTVRIMAHLAVSQTHMWTGRWDRSVEHFERVLALYEPERHQEYITQYAQNPRFTASNSGFWSEWMMGHPERANAVSEEAIAEAKALNHEFTYTIAFLGRPLVAWFRRRYDEFQASVGDYVTTAARSGNPFYIAFSMSLDGAARVLRGEHVEGLAELEAQYAAMGALGSKLVDPLIVTLLAEGYLTAGRPADAAALLDRVMPEFERDGRVSFQPDHLRLRAEALLRSDPEAREAALALLQQAIAVAREHGARSFQLRAALVAAPVLRDLGREDEGRALVAEAYGTFTEGFDDPDLVEARAWLA
jgi:tetratricopeptide (TPR) repeat protein